jgi:ABC-type uncharacterized transport system ATPase subunit
MIRGKLVLVPFLFDDLSATKVRPAVCLTEPIGPRRWLCFRREEITAAELIAVVSARYCICDLAIEEPEIEGIVHRIYEAGL